MNNLIIEDQAQRQLALNPAKSFIVQAPAGSGKTELLIQRFLTLLEQVNTPEEILAITFTKKAANEMRSRVIKALKQAYLSPEPTISHAKQTWLLAKKVLQKDAQCGWNLINNPNQIRIQTIDSLCTYLTTQLPLLSHFGSSPKIVENPLPLYREAVQEVLTHLEQEVEWSPAIAKLLLHLDNDWNKLHDLLVSLLAKRDQWLSYLHVDANSQQIRKQLEKQLELIIADKLTFLIELFPKTLINELLTIARFAADNLLLSDVASDIVACRELTHLPSTLPTDKKKWRGLAKLLLTKNFSWRKRVDHEIGFPSLTSLKNSQEKIIHTEYRKRHTQLIAEFSKHENLRLALIEVFFLPDFIYQDTQWEVLQALLDVLKIVAAQLRLVFQQHGQIDFIENAQAALLALGHDEITDLVLALDYQIKHILVDEFQDTSYSQYKLLEKLVSGWETNDGKTLFVVGDPMQSIYRFRQAEVGLFLRMRKIGIGNVNLIPITLAVNFRSITEIVEWNNVHFRSIFPLSDDMGTGAVTYSKSISQQTTQEEKNSHAVTIQGFADADEQTQATHIITLIEQLQQKFPQDKIAILVRSRGHLTNIIPALKKAKIPFQAIDIDPLASRPAIQDLLSLTCALLHPADRIAWLAILRAPWCGLTLADLLIIAGSNPYSTIWQQLSDENILQKLSSDGQLRLNKLLPILKQTIDERERYPLRAWIENAWILLGGPACLMDYNEKDDTNAFFALLDEFAKNHLIINLDKLKEKISSLYATTQHNNALLQIMTIHTAKGLEFDTVILPHLERKMPVDDKSLLLWMEQPLANEKNVLVLAPIHATGEEKDSIYEYMQRQQKIKLYYETDRLFYVATTRAKKRLYLFFDIIKKDNQEFRIDTGSFLEKLWPFIKNNSEQIITTQHKKIIDSHPSKKQRYTIRLHSNWKNPIENGLHTDIISHQQTSGFQFNSNVQQLIGVASHRILQQMAQFGIDWWETRNSAEQTHYLNYQLQQLGVLPHQLLTAKNTLQQILDKTLNDQKGRWILQAHQENQAELALTVLLNNKIERLVIDRTFVDKQGIRWIIDYKTTTLTHHELQHFLQQEQKKYKEKMQQYYHALRLIDPHPIKLGLYFPAIPAWHEWEAT